MSQRRMLKVLTTMPALIAMATAAPAVHAASLVFSFLNGLTGASGTIQTAASAAFMGSDVALTTGTFGQHEAGAAWYKTKQDITSFSTDFTFSLASGLPIPSIVGMTFCVQNSNSTTNPMGPGPVVSADTNLAGYGAYDPSLGSQWPIGNSIAVKFDINNSGELNYASGRSPNSTGLYINGGPKAALVPQQDLNPYGINLYSGHVMAAHIVYDGSLLTMTLRDTVTNAQYRTSWPVDIPSVVGGNTAYVGFTAGTIPAVANSLISWSFSEGYPTRLSSPTFSVSAGSYSAAQSVTINAPAGSTVYYTTNGQQPTSSSPKYTGPINVGTSEIVQAVAIQSGFTDSLVATANYQIAPSGTPTINFASGFANASNFITVNGTAMLNGSSIQLTDTSNYLEAGSAWYDVPVNVQSFSSNFTLNLQNANANGMTFTIQNQPPTSADKSILYVSGGPNAIGNNQSGLGYSGSTGNVGGQNAGLLNSVALAFDLYSGSGNLVGLYTNGAMPTGSSTDMSSSGLSLHSGNPLNVALTYDGSTLAMTITDTKTKASFSKSWSVNIPSIVGNNTAYVGFTGATGGLTAVQDISAWTFSTKAQTVAVPAAPTNLRVQ